MNMGGMGGMSNMSMSMGDNDWHNKYDNVEIGLPTMITGILGMIVVVILTYVVLTHKPERAENLSEEDRKKETEQFALAEEISQAIHIGAREFLKLEYTALSIVAAALFILICIAINWQTGICYLFGCLCSAFCGFVGMMICTKANVKTAIACRTSLNAGLRVAFNAGSVMGLTVVSVALILLSVTLMAFDSNAFSGRGALAGLGMGASTVSIFARVGGGIFTKAADVGADLVGKVENDLPEDDIRNPATIADNVGDNVGDVAGMGADLFSSFVGSTVAAALLGNTDYGHAGVALSYWIMLSGLVASVIGMLFVRTGENATQGQLLDVIRRGQLVAAFCQIGFFAVAVHMTEMPWKFIAILIIGLVAGLCIGVFSEFFTSYAHPMTRSITKSARAGAGNVIIQGLAVGSFSTIPLALVIAAVILASYSIAGDSFYGVALVSCALLSTLAITLATDAYGPVADNAGGIAEMCHMPPQTRENTDLLDALGNTTAAIGKGFAVGSAILTAVSLLANFAKRVHIYTPGEENGPLDVMTDRFIAGLLLGAMIPFWFSALTMSAVGKAAQSVVAEVRYQFHNIPGLKEGTAKADHPRCVRMITTAALHAMVYPVLVVVLSPLIVGIGLGTRFLAGFVLGVDVTGFMLGFQQSIAGGAWDNGKKFIEAGHYGGKGSAAHKAAVVGDTVGDPFKDTSGPSLNILIKLVSYNTVVLSDIYNNQGDYWWVSLILIGILLVFIPFWEWMTPLPMQDHKIEEVYTLLAQEEKDAKAAAAASAAAASSSSSLLSPAASSSSSVFDGKSSVEVNVELGALDLPGSWGPGAIPSGHFKIVNPNK